MSTFPRKDFPIKWVRVGEISVVWAQSQRAINERGVERIMTDFDPDVFGVLTVTLPNGQGIHHAIDGQHRAEAVRRMYGDDEMVPCLVLPAKSAKEAAHIFRAMNTSRSAPGAMNNFRVGVAAGYEAETEVHGLLTRLGYRVGHDGADGCYSAVAAALSIRRRHGLPVLQDAFLTIQKTWGMARDSVHQCVVQGYAEIVARYEGALDRKRLIDRVAKKYTPARLIGAARQAQDFQGGTITSGVLGVLVTTYNHGLAADSDKRIDEGNAK